MDLITKEKPAEHPLEEIFDIEPNTTMMEYTEVVPSETVQAPSYDDKDLEIEAQYDEIYNLALGGVTAISDEMQLVEGKYKARIGEVMANNLNVALSAAKEKASLKAHKDKLAIAQGKLAGPTGAQNITNNNLVVTSQAELLKMLRQQRDE